ncbi:hypothetical protein K1719_003767 [Acacia pycnantha]|nr:hypothetical protein K1719_003767 [Acacia pycnantha]
MDTLSKESSKSVLEMEQVYVSETLHFNAGKFPSLKLLGLDDLGGLKSIIVEEGSMPNLKRLIIQRCGSLKQVKIIGELNMYLRFIQPIGNLELEQRQRPRTQSLGEAYAPFGSLELRLKKWNWNLEIGLFGTWNSLHQV